MLFEADAIELPPSDDDALNQPEVPYDKNNNKPLQVIKPGGLSNQKSSIKIMDSYQRADERGRPGRPNDEFSDMPLQFNVSPMHPENVGFVSENKLPFKNNLQKPQQAQTHQQSHASNQAHPQQLMHQNHHSPPPNNHLSQQQRAHINSSSKKMGTEVPSVVHLSLKDMKKDLNNSTSHSNRGDTSSVHASAKKGRSDSTSSMKHSTSKPSPKRQLDSEAKSATDRSATNKTSSETPERNNELRVSFTTAQTSRKCFRLSKDELDLKSDDYKELYFFYEQEMNENTYLRNVLKKETLCSEEQRAIIEVLKSVIEEKGEENPLSELLMSFKNSASDQCRNIDIFMEFLKFREDYERKCQINASLEEKLSKLEDQNNGLMEQNAKLLEDNQNLYNHNEKTNLMNEELIRECDGLSQQINKNDALLSEKADFIAKMQNENNDLNRKLSVAARDLERLQKKKEEIELHDGLLKELDSSRDKLKRAKEEQEALSSQIAQLMDNKRNLDLRLAAIEKEKIENTEKHEKYFQDLSKRQQEIESKNSSLSKEIHERDAIIAALRSDVKMLREKLDETKNVYEALEELQEEKRLLIEKIEDDATKLRIIEREIQLNKHSKEGLVEANESLKREYEDLTSTRDELRDKLENERKNKAQELTKTMEEMSKLRIELREVNEQKSKWMGEKEQLLEELRETETERNELIGHLKSLEMQIKEKERNLIDMESCFRKLKNETEELVQERNDIEKKFELVYKENNGLLHELSKAGRERGDKAQNESLQNKYQELKHELLKEKSVSSSQEKLLGKVNKALRNINGEIKNQLGKKVDILKLDFSLDLSGVDSEVIGSLDDLKNLVSLCLAEMELGFNEKASLKTKLQEVNSKAKQTENKYRYLKETIGKENNRMEIKKYELTQCEQERKELKRKNQILSSGLEEYSEERQKIVDDMKTLKKENRALKQKLSELGKENELLTKSIEGNTSVQQEKKSVELKILEEKSHKLKFERNTLREILDKAVRFITNLEIKSIVVELRDIEIAIYDEEKVINDVVAKIEDSLAKESSNGRNDSQAFLVAQLREQLGEKEEKLRNLISKRENYVETLDEIYQANKFANQNNDEIQRLSRENAKLKNDLNCMKNELEIKKLALMNSRSDEDSFQKKYSSNPSHTGAIARAPRDLKRNTWADEFSVETKENFNDNIHHTKTEEVSNANEKSIGQNSSFQKISSAGSIKKQKKDSYL